MKISSLKRLNACGEVVTQSNCQRYFQIFPRDAFFILIYEELIKDPAPQLDALAGFLGLPFRLARSAGLVRQALQRVRDSAISGGVRARAALWRGADAPRSGLDRSLGANLRYPEDVRDARLQAATTARARDACWQTTIVTRSQIWKVSWGAISSLVDRVMFDQAGSQGLCRFWPRNAAPSPLPWLSTRVPKAQTSSRC